MPKKERNQMAYVSCLTPVTRRRGSFTSSSQVPQQSQQNELDTPQSSNFNPDNIQPQTQTDWDSQSLEEVPPEPFKQHPSNNIEITAVENIPAISIISAKMYTKRRRSKRESGNADPLTSQRAPKRSRISSRNPSATETHQQCPGGEGDVLPPPQPTVTTPKKSTSSPSETPTSCCTCKMKVCASEPNINQVNQERRLIHPFSPRPPMGTLRSRAANQKRRAMHPFSPRPPIRTIKSRVANPHSAVNNRIRTGRFCPQTARSPARQSIWRFEASRFACTIL
ncbi:hypothetical protein CDAR_424591 [Caerostris darwini]|uniref:Uncharacterized protein n=1 Tax=Caerostris darwini TaxID=1538125 RepID=A0AAV4VAX7_9ARAC|nr:hypothetical protein CDAR_424591 [Caerostris darwini]